MQRDYETNGYADEKEKFPMRTGIGSAHEETPTALASSKRKADRGQVITHSHQRIAVLAAFGSAQADPHSLMYLNREYLLGEIWQKSVVLILLACQKNVTTSTYTPYIRSSLPAVVSIASAVAMRIKTGLQS